MGPADDCKIAFPILFQNWTDRKVETVHNKKQFIESPLDSLLSGEIWDPGDMAYRCLMCQSYNQGTSCKAVGELG